MTAKETVRAPLERLPDDCGLDDVLYHLYVVQAVGEGVRPPNPDLQPTTVVRS
jgi:hypothetical protein